MDRKVTIRLMLLLLVAAFVHNLFHEFGHWLVGTLLGDPMSMNLNYAWPPEPIEPLLEGEPEDELLELEELELLEDDDELLLELEELEELLDVKSGRSSAVATRGSATNSVAWACTSTACSLVQ